MSNLTDISKKDPLHLADDDHPDRKDISEKELGEALQELKKKFGTKKEPGKRTDFSKGVIESLNATQQ